MGSPSRIEKIPRSFALHVDADRADLVRSLTEHPRCRLARELRPFPPPPSGAPVLLTYGESELRLRHYVSPWEVGAESPLLVIRLISGGQDSALELRGRFELSAGHAPRLIGGGAFALAIVALLTQQWTLFAAASALLALTWTARRYPAMWADARDRARMRALWNVASDALFQHARAPVASRGAPYRSIA